MSNAFTNEVQTIGITKVSQGQCVKIAYNNQAVESKNTIHQTAIYFFLVCSMKNYFRKSKARADKSKQNVQKKLGNL